MTDANPQPPINKPRPAADRPPEETIKETIESLVIAFILAFVFRAYVVEPFVIPTGSMAPTLLGAHMPVTCDGCGYHFKSEWDPAFTASSEGQIVPLQLRRDQRMVYACPMCRYPNVVTAANGRPRSGDRILVHKYLYSFTEPQRWDVVVFKNPADPHDNYIKRLVGLPNENLFIFEGNIFTQPVDPRTGRGEADAWRIARKTDRTQVQRAVFQPVYHSQYIPLDEGRGRETRGGNYRWSVPWTTTQPGAWTLENTRAYRYRGVADSVLHFDFQAALRPARPGSLAPNFYAYNQLQPAYFLEPIEDVRVSATVQPETADLTISVSTTARLPGLTLQREPYRLRGTLDARGRATIDARHPETGKTITLVEASARPLRQGRRTQMELWYVDQQASLWIDGRKVLVHDFDAPFDEMIARPPLPEGSLPAIAIEVSGPVTLHNVEVDRDLFYQDVTRDIHAMPLRGHVDRSNPVPLHIGPDEFFCVGDNGPRSLDGRYWHETTLNEWTKALFLTDRVERGEDPAGIVPREMLIGRAFFVYFPSPYHIGLVPLPNFGEMRFIH